MTTVASDVYRRGTRQTYMMQVGVGFIAVNMENQFRGADLARIWQ